MATVSCLVINILLNIFLCAQEKKETQADMEQYEGE